MSDTPHTLRVPARFCGPPTSGNGGYVSGLLAERLGQPLEVTLRSPPPLDRELRVEVGAVSRLLDGELLVAQACEKPLDLQPPAAPTLAQAEAWSRGYPGFLSHAFPECFVCGPARAPGDGLRIFPGPSPDGSLVAAPWVADGSLVDATGGIPLAVAWAALDCAGYFACAHPSTAVLGRICANVLVPLMAATPYVVIGWSLGHEGRKHHAGTALFDAQGRPCGVAKQTWIVIG
jgi:hypothetical protein